MKVNFERTVLYAFQPLMTQPWGAVALFYLFHIYPRRPLWLIIANKPHRAEDEYKQYYERFGYQERGR